MLFLLRRADGARPHDSSVRNLEFWIVELWFLCFRLYPWGGRRSIAGRRAVGKHALGEGAGFVAHGPWQQRNVESSMHRTPGGQVRYRIALHKSDEGYSVSVPGMPGCWSQGATEDEAVENIRDAIREYLSVVDEQLRGEDVREIEVTV